MGFSRRCDSRVKLRVVGLLLLLDYLSVRVAVSSLRWTDRGRSCRGRIVERERAVEKPGIPRSMVDHSTVLYRRYDSELIVGFWL